MGLRKAPAAAYQAILDTGEGAGDAMVSAVAEMYIFPEFPANNSTILTLI